MPDPQQDLALLERAAEAAGAIALGYFRKPVEVREKDGQGPVTEADLAVDAMLREELCAARPDYGWLSEEAADMPGRLSARRLFIVDPIDGTRAFISGDTGFATALAVVERGRTIAAVVHLPAREETYTATLGGGARRNGRPIACSTCTDLARATVLGAKKQLLAEHWPGGVPPSRRHFRSSLAWRLCLAAAGYFDFMVTMRETFDWDIAAGSLIAGEAGLRVTDRDGRDLRFDRDRPLQPGVLAAPPALHRQLLALRQAPRRAAD